MAANAQVSATDPVDVELSVVGSGDSGAAMAAPLSPTLQAFTGIISDAGGIIDLPAGTYQVRFRMTEMPPCDGTVTAVSPTLTVMLLGTTA